ncbi:hypothetical protein I5M27_03790 [Adhaeribacter sp. BT258]|uniref:DUF3828 domain-containing protein n=1 Tax=Adhaeribacter terrigena TaxID=2793070 RepID=A0ABS1BY75_9BACT|nr:hypothetical protein [Adhaeribacter terrigena]MBK0402091.1 hypothetical protein [Adhaeribacter terrigena]
MKNFLFVIILQFICGCNNLSTEKEDILFIKKFYQEYNGELSKEAESISKRDSILKSYCTSRLVSFLEKQYRENELDWDPFLNAQDMNIKTPETLRVIKENSKYNLYSISYVWAPTGDTVDNIGLIIINEKGTPKIDYVYIGEGFGDEKYKDVEMK